MAIISDGTNTYREHDGKRELISPENASMKIGDRVVYRFDGKSGLLELSMCQSDIDRMVKMLGGLPVAQMQVPTPFEQPIVQNVKEIRPLPTKDGTFLMSLSQKEPEAPATPETRRLSSRRSWFRKPFGRISG